MNAFEDIGPVDQYIGMNRKLFPWEREHFTQSVSGALVTFYRDSVERPDGYVRIRRGNDRWVFKTEDFIEALKAMGFVSQ